MVACVPTPSWFIVNAQRIPNTKTLLSRQWTKYSKCKAKQRSYKSNEEEPIKYLKYFSTPSRQLWQKPLTIFSFQSYEDPPPALAPCLYAPKCLYPVFGLTVLCLHNLGEVQKGGIVRQAFSLFYKSLKPCAWNICQAPHTQWGLLEQIMLSRVRWNGPFQDDRKCF